MSNTNPLFAELQQGTDITKGLKHLTKEEKERRKAAAKEAGGKIQMKNKAPTKPNTVKAPVSLKEPLFELVQGREWRVENHRAGTINVNDVKFNHVVNIRDSTDTTFIIDSKCNSILVDNCKGVILIFNGVMTGLEVIKCRKLKVQILEGVLPSMTVENVDDAKYYLNAASRDCLITYGSIESNNLYFPSKDGDGEMISKTLPEQFVVTIDKEKDVINHSVSDFFKDDIIR
eukprot:GHVH01004558.1.p1 GENE.GHVH01004558.1~~GHVH01004558.1.p1  ORF type:complete len:231 (+),score=38.81 GHVH01004558.1:58-750(+)